MATYGLEFSEIYARIKKYANIKKVVNADTEAKNAANDALRDIASLRNWEILKRESTVTPVDGTSAYAILTGTADFDHIISCWYIFSGNRIPIEVVDDARWNREVDESFTGTPEICRITKADGTLKIEFSPAPDASFVSQYTNIKLDYIKKVTELSDDDDVPEVPDTSQQMAIVYRAVADLLAGQSDHKGMAIYELKAARLMNQAHKIDDKKEGRSPRIGRPMIPINSSKSSGIQDYQA